MYKPMSEKELQETRVTVARMQSALKMGMQPAQEVVNAFVDSVVPRLFATIDAKDAEIKRVSGALADEILDAEAVGVLQMTSELTPGDLGIDEDDAELYDGWQGV